MRLKGIMTLVIVAALLMSLGFTGCGKTDDSKTQTIGSQSTEAGKAVQTEAGEMVGNMYKTGLPIVKEKITLKMVARKRAFAGNYEEMNLITDLEERTNIHIDWNAIPQSQYEEKKNLLLASNDLPDAFFGQTALTNADLVTYGPIGVFIDMTGLIKDYAPILTKLMASDEMFNKVAYSPDGKIYGLPRARQIGYNDAPDQMFMYKPWLDKLGLAVPTTLDEFHAVLKAFKTSDPNGNGKADEIPFTFRYKTHYQGMYSLFGAFGLPDNVLTEDLSHMIIKDGKVVYVPVQQEYEKAIQYFNAYFKDGLVDPESFTQDVKQYTAKGATADVTVGAFISWNDFDVAGADRKNDYVIVPPMAGPDGERIWNKYMHDNNGIVGTGFSITKQNKYPEATMRWVDEFYDPDFSIQVQFGPLGININKKGDGSYEFIPTPEGMTYDEFNFKNSPVDAPSAVFKEVFDSKKLPMSEEAEVKYAYVEKYYRPYMTVQTFPGAAMFTPEETKTIKTMSTDIYNYVNDMQAKWLLNGGIEKEWDGYLGKLKQMKLDDMLSIYQTAYDRFNKK